MQTQNVGKPVAVLVDSDGTVLAQKNLLDTDLALEKEESKELSVTFSAEEVEGTPAQAVVRYCYKVDFDVNGGSGTIDPVFADIDGHIELPTAKPTPPTQSAGEEPLFFGGWYTAKEGGEKITADSVFTENTTVFAHYVPHQHAFTYSADGATITASCGGGGSECDITDGLTLTVSAPASDTLTYDGTAKEASLNTDYDTTAFPDSYAITYTKDGNALESAPTDAGTYRASVTVGTGDAAQTAYVDYTIKPAPMSTVTATMQNLPYTGGIVNAQYALTYKDLTLVAGTDFDAGNETSAVEVGQHTIRFDGKGNYEGTIYARWNITAASVIVTANDVSKVYGDDDPELTAKVTGLADGDTVSYTISRATGENAGEYEITVTGDATQGNYSITYMPGKFTINKAAVTVTPDKKNKFYGDADPALTATVTVAGRANGNTSLLDGEEIHYTLTRAEGENVGTYAITAANDTSQSNDAIKANYEVTDVTYGTGTFQITKRPLSKSFVSLDHVSFRNDGTSHAPKPVFTDYTVTESDYTLTGDTSQSDNGAYTLTVKAKTDGNFGGSVSFAWFITDVGDNAVTYDGKPHGISVGEGASVLYQGSDGEYAATPVTYTDAGTYQIAYRTQVENPFYDADDPEIEPQYIDVDGTATLAIAKRSVTIKAENQTVGLNAAIATGADAVSAGKVTASGVDSVADSGLAEGHSVSAVTLTASEGTANTTDSGTIIPSEAAIQDGGGNDVTQNYEIAYANGALTVEKATPSVTPPAAIDLSYNGSAQSLVTAGSTDGGELQYALGDGDTAPADSEYSTTIPTGTNAGTYAVWYRVVGNDNYNDVAPAKVSVTVGKAAISPTVSITGWTYGDSANTPAIGEGDNPGNGTVSYAYKAKGAEDGEYSATVPTAAGEYTVRATVAETDNYQSGAATADFTIAKTGITASVTLDGWTYGESAKTPSLGEGSNPGNGDVTYEYKLKDAADSAYSTTVPTDAGDYTVKATIAATDNYSGNAATADFTIAKAPLTITANAHAIAYGDAPQGNGVTYGVTDESGSVQNGFVNNETEAVLSGEPSYTFNYNQYGNVGSYEITPAGLTSGNYDITFVNGTLTVNPKEISLTWGNTDFTYNGTEQTPAVTVDGLVHNDSPESVVRVTGGETNANAKTGETSYTATATLTNSNYTLSGDSPTTTTTNFTIDQKKLAKSNLTLPSDPLVYTGAEIGPEYSVKDTINGQETALTEDEDFEVTGGKTAEEIGSYNISFRGIGNYTGNFRSAWSITAPTVTIQAEATSKVYGDADPELTVKFDGLADGDTGDWLSYAVSRESGEDVGQYAITVTVENAAQGNYQVQADNSAPAYLTITKATATVTADAKSKVYGDDDPTLTATVTGLKNGDTADVIPAYSLSRETGENVGAYTITVSGDAESGNYTVGYQSGTLNIAKRPLSADFVSLDHSSFRNDGNEHEPQPVFDTYTVTKSDYELGGACTSSESGVHRLTIAATSGGNFSGSVSLDWYITDAGDETVVYDGQAHSISVTEGATVLYKGSDGEYTSTPVTYTDVGTYQIAYRTEVDNPYYESFPDEPETITVEGTATLTITKRSVTLTSATENKPYDGKALTNKTVDVAGDGWATNEGAEYSVTGTQTLVGSSPNAFTYTLNSNTKADNYNITKTEGTLTVTSRDAKYQISPQANSDSVKYDGTAHTVSGFVTDSFTVDGNVYTVSGLTAEGTGTDAGNYTVSVSGTAVVKDSDGNDVTDEFSVTPIAGTLTIAKRDVTLTSDSAAKEYDGTALTNHNVTVSGDGFVAGQGATYSVTGSRTLVGSAENEFGYTLNEGTNPDNYAITTTKGVLTVNNRDTKYTVTLKANSETFAYDGIEKTVKGYAIGSNASVSDEDGALSASFTAENNLTYTITGMAAEIKGTDAGTHTLNVTGTPTVKDSDGNDVTAQFTVSVESGTLTINKRAVTLTSATDSKTYDGAALTNDAVTVGGDGFVNGQGATYNVTGSQTLPGESANAFTYALNEGTKADNYDITKVEGTLTVTNRTADGDESSKKYEITVTANSGEFLYNGAEHSVSGFETLEYVINGVTYTVSGIAASASLTDAGETAVAITGTPVVKDGNGNNLTAQFIVNMTPGKLTVNKRNVTLTSATETREYNGNALTNDTVTVGGDGWATNEGAEYSVTGTQTLVGNSPNAFTYTLNSNAKADNYNITKSEGTLTVANRTARYEISPQANSDSVKYDGTAHTVSGFVTNSFTVDGNVYTVSGLTASGSGTDVGNYTVSVSGTAVVKDSALNNWRVKSSLVAKCS